MTQLSLVLPEENKPDKTEDPKVTTALTSIQSVINGNLDNTNIKSKSLTETNLSEALKEVLGINSEPPHRGKSFIETEQETTSATYTKLTNADEVTVVLPTNGLIIVWVKGLWKVSGAANGFVGLFLGANQIKVGEKENAGGNVEVKALGSFEFSHFVSGGYNLFTDLSTVAGKTSSDVTTGQVVGVADGQGAGEAKPQGPAGSPIAIFASAGTYVVSLQFKVEGGNKVIAKNRHLWVEAKSF